MSKYEKLIGQKIGSIYIESIAHKDKWGTYLLNIKCDCGYTGNMYKRYIVENKRCPICGNRSKYKGINELSGCYWKRLERNAIDRKIPFSINVEYGWYLFEQQNRKCALSGLDLFFDTKYYHKNHKTKQNASLDRINSNIGYIEGNVQWVDKDVNFLKNNRTEKDFYKLINIIYEFGVKNDKIHPSSISNTVNI